jgi:hypothetical protein
MTLRRDFAETSRPTLRKERAAPASVLCFAISTTATIRKAFLATSAGCAFFLASSVRGPAFRRPALVNAGADTRACMFFGAAISSTSASLILSNTIL